jgi:hypothetical protein
MVSAQQSKVKQSKAKQRNAKRRQGNRNGCFSFVSLLFFSGVEGALDYLLSYYNTNNTNTCRKEKT